MPQPTLPPEDPVRCPPGLSAEHTATLRAVAAYRLPAATDHRLPTAALDDGTWEGLLTAAANEGLLGLLTTAIDDHALPATESQAAAARELATAAIGYCLRLEGELLRAETLLAPLGIPLRVLKGPATARLDYPDPTLRTFIDIDLLIRSEDFDRAVITLSDAGYGRRYVQLRSGFDRRFSKGVCFATPHGTALDVHRTFVTGPFGLRVQLDDLWETGSSFDVAGRSFAALPPEQRLLHACYHASLGDWPPRLVPHRDIVQILVSGAVSESRVRELSTRWGANAVLATGVTTAWRLLGLSEQTALTAWAQDYAVSASDRRAIGLHARPDTNYASKSLAALTAVPGVRNKAAFVRALLLPDRGYVSSRRRSRLSHVVRGVAEARRSGRS